MSPMTQVPLVWLNSLTTWEVNEFTSLSPPAVWITTLDPLGAVFSSAIAAEAFGTVICLGGGGAGAFPFVVACPSDGA